MSYPRIRPFLSISSGWSHANITKLLPICGTVNDLTGPGTEDREKTQCTYFLKCKNARKPQQKGMLFQTRDHFIPLISITNLTLILDLHRDIYTHKISSHMKTAFIWNSFEILHVNFIRILFTWTFPNEMHNCQVFHMKTLVNSGEKFRGKLTQRRCLHVYIFTNYKSNAFSCKCPGVV